MAKIAELQPEWFEWVKTRPDCIRDLCERFPPDRLYRLKESGQRVTLYSYCEDGTMTVAVSGEYNLVVFGRCVFGVFPDELEECDLPDPSQLTGAILTEQAEVQAFVDAIRPEILKGKKARH